MTLSLSSQAHRSHVRSALGPMLSTLLLLLASIGGIHRSSATAQPACARPAQADLVRHRRTR